MKITQTPPALFLLALITTLLTASLSAPAAPPPERWPSTQRGLILVPDEAHGVTTALAVERLRSKSPIRLDLVDGARDNRTDFNNYDLVIILGVTGDNKELAQAWAGARPDADDAWALKTISKKPLVIAATGNRPRSTLYAVWALADMLAAGDDLTALDRRETPRVPDRYAVVCGTAFGGHAPWNANRHSLYMSTIDELPRHGINGIFLCPGDWRVAVGPGKVMPPLVIAKDGTVSVDEEKLPAWRAMIGELKARDLKIIITIEPLVPPAYNAKQIERDYITNGKAPPGYLKAVETFFRNYMEKVVTMFPDIDGYVLHAGVEGAQYSGANAKSIRTFLSKQNLHACVENMEVYLKVADEITRKHNKTLTFWPHQWGINSDGIAAMRKMLFNYPRYAILEEDYWPNALWINGDKLPILAFLDETLRAEIDQHGNKLAILALSDAEYFGGGALPNAIAEPYIYSMNEAVKRNAGMVIFRLNLHDRTPYGSLWSTAGIQLEQSASLLWNNPPPPAQIWDRWIKRAYGAAAAPLVSRALSASCKIIQDGFAGQLDQGSRVSATEWMPGKNGAIAKFANPAKTPRAKKTGPIESPDQFRAQLGQNFYGHATYAQAGQKNRAAAAEVRRSLELIEQARPALAKADYAYLRDIHNAARILLDVFQAMDQAAYACNLRKDNYDNMPDPEKFHEQAMRDLEQCAASEDVRWLTTQRGHVYGNVAGELQKLIAAYRGQ